MSKESPQIVATLCGKCGKQFLEDGEPFLIGTPLCECSEVVVSTARPVPAVSERAERDLNLPGFRDAIAQKLVEHRVTPDTKRKLCSTCKALGSTFGCLRCNSAPTTIRW